MNTVLFNFGMKLMRFKEKNASLVCTLSPALPMAKFPREILGITDVVQYNSNVVFNNMVAGTKAALENGVKVGLGTDTGCPLHNTLQYVA